jgi:hypothetical protein
MKRQCPPGTQPGPPPAPAPCVQGATDYYYCCQRQAAAAQAAAQAASKPKPFKLDIPDFTCYTLPAATLPGYPAAQYFLIQLFQIHPLFRPLPHLHFQPLQRPLFQLS